MAFEIFALDDQGFSLQNPVMVRTTATTNSSGNYTVDISNAGITHVHNVNVTVLSTGSAVNQTRTASVTTMSTTAVSGTVFNYVTTLGVLSNLSAVGSGVTVLITVEGDQN